MVISVEELIRLKKDKIELDFSENIESIVYNDDVYKLASPLSITGTISTTKQGIYIDSNVDYTIVAPCSRCLKDVEVPLNYDVQGFLVEEEDFREDEFEDLDAFFYNGSDIELVELISQTLDFNLPTKVLCNESCKGLCYTCGADLNINECSCNKDTNDEEHIDPRLAKLKDLFNKE
ncbi:MAG: YceD family protein [Clostridioides sp.]|jgi:uncharacterized protein|nr:YceD family protein [Clostridioides sp.]